MAKKNRPVPTEPLFEGLNLESLSLVETVPSEKAEKFSVASVDFSLVDRPRTCLEVDFPIVQVNLVSNREATGPCTKPIYKMNKWWARRRSSVFRQLLISSALRAPSDETKAAQESWRQMYRKSHLKHGVFSSLHVVDPFMGGGTTVAEAARLGFKVTGVDLNPIAWWVVRNQMNPVPESEIRSALNKIESIVQNEIQRFYSHESPWGFQTSSVEEKPELVYTFWLKHIPCLDPDCFHLTPQIVSNVFAKKTFIIKSYQNCACPKCGEVFDIELSPHRLAPKARFQLADDEIPFAVLKSESGSVECPHCQEELSAENVASIFKRKGKSTKKTVEHSLCIPGSWLKGISGKSKNEYGGYFGSSAEQDKQWFKDRSAGLFLIEIRGQVPDELHYSSYANAIKESDSGDSDDSQSRKIKCGKCGRVQDPLESLRVAKHLAPIFPFAIHGFDPVAKKNKFGYNGRFYDQANTEQILDAVEYLKSRKDLWDYIPVNAVFQSNQLHNWAVPDHGYTHWHYMFNPRQLLANALVLKSISDLGTASTDLKSQLLGAWQNFLRHNCMFTLWNIQADQLEPHFSNNNYRPKSMPIENCVFSPVGRGSFRACVEMVIDGMSYLNSPYDLKANDTEEGPKTEKIKSDDLPKKENVTLLCQSSTDLKRQISDQSVDLVITDPPFGDLVDYSELADFFLVWLHRPLSKLFPSLALAAESPKSLEVVSNPLRHQGIDESTGKKKADANYDRLLTMCWKESARILKPSGILAFTFHHSKDQAWIDILDSLFKSGFYLEATYPVRSDATKGKGEFGARKIEFDIIHVCKKRSAELTEIYWATLRKRIVETVKSHAAMLAQHRLSGLHLADIEVLLRGEVLKEYSKHYGMVKKNLSGDLVTIKEILLEANSLALNLLQEQEDNRPPDIAEFQTKVYFSLLREGPKIEKTAAIKRLKGSGVTLDELVKQGWIALEKSGSEKFVRLVPPGDRWQSLSRKSELQTDLDQVHFAINCCLGGRQIEGKVADWESWLLDNYRKLLPSVGTLLKFIEINHFGSDYKQAIGIAYRTLERTLQRIKETDGEFKKASEQMSLFGN